MEQLADEGHDIPAIKDRPRLYLDLFCFMDAFQELSCRRASGWSICPISYEAIMSYLILHQVPQSLWAEYVKWICYMDNVYLKLIQEEDKK